jgi:hypothetical protein
MTAALGLRFGLNPLQVLALEGDDYILTSAVVQRAVVLEAELLEQVIEALSVRIGNAVARSLGG